MYRIGEKVVVNDRMQWNHAYEISALASENFMPGFEPKFSPAAMLVMDEALEIHTTFVVPAVVPWPVGLSRRLCW